MNGRYIFMWILLLGLCSTNDGCGAADENVKKSMTQYELAVGLHQEGNVPGAFQALTSAVELDPYNAKAHLFLGTLYLFSRKNNQIEYDRKAEECFRTVLKIQSGDYASPENLSADAHNKLGVLYIHQKRYQDSIKELKVAVSDLYNRKAYLAWGNLGWAYLEIEKYDQAIHALLRSIDLEHRFCVGYFRLGQVYSSMRDFEKAEKAFTKAIEADERCKSFQDAWRLRGEVRAKLGEREDAIADFERCVELDQDSETGDACSRLLSSTHE
ncbi:MAG: tetratricopeptide repeat protein [Deltaproteobacteria bacterium]|nr:tetratricopeptide repeat protein [Deltaproteobacteria bacterium]